MSLPWPCRDRKSTRLNSSHVEISYAVFCLKNKRQGRRLTTFATPQARPHHHPAPLLPPGQLHMRAVKWRDCYSSSVALLVAPVSQAQEMLRCAQHDSSRIVLLECRVQRLQNKTALGKQMASKPGLPWRLPAKGPRNVQRLTRTLTAVPARTP